MSSGVEFEEDKFSYGSPRPGNAPGGMMPNFGHQPQNQGSKGMSGWLVRNGWANSEKGAQGVLLAIVIINAIITFVVIKYFL